MKKPLSVFGKKIGSFNLKNACMIDPHELRIGNWVKVGTIESIVDYLHLGSIGLQGNAIINNFQQVDPIPLTPEILEKCGFEKHITSGIASLDDEEKYGDTYYFEKHIKESEVCDSFDFTLVKWGDSELTFSNHWLRVRIKSLHQLQNLYFALSGTELNYSPDNKN